MLTNIWNSVLSFFRAIFHWLYVNVVSHILYLFNTIWNWIIDRFWDLFTAFISWLCESIAYFISSDSLDYNANYEDIFYLVAGLDQIFPIHETFLLLSFLFLYHTVRLLIRYGSFLLSVLRKLLPF